MTDSEFMRALHKRLIDERKMAITTADRYIANLKKMNKDRPYNNLTFLRDTDAIEKHMEDYKQTSQQSLYSMLVAVLSLFVKTNNRSPYRKAYTFYHTRMNETTIKNKEEKKNNMKTDTQKNSWLPWDDILAKRAELAEIVKPYSNENVLNKKEFNNLTNHLVVSLYTYIPPRRNQDYQIMDVVKLTDDKLADELPNTTNYLVVVDGKPTRFIYNVYKTARFYGKQEIIVPDDLADVLKRWIQFHPKNKFKKFPLLTDVKGQKLPQTNSITRILNRVFKNGLGASMLRHIYLSTKYDVEEMEKDAQDMGHSLEQQREYMKKSDDD